MWREKKIMRINSWCLFTGGDVYQCSRRPFPFWNVITCVHQAGGFEEVLLRGATKGELWRVPGNKRKWPVQWEEGGEGLDDKVQCPCSKGEKKNYDGL